MTSPLIDPAQLGHGGWDGHLDDVATILEPLVTMEHSPADVLVYVDNVAGEMCPVHVTILVHLAYGALAGAGFTSADIKDALAGMRGRPDETVPYDTAL